MKINKIKINGFGNLENKEIILENGINLIYGKNEKGKSTLLKFILSMFYGISKNRNSKELNDIEKYTPWQAKDFSGNIEYNLENGENYKIYRDFSKKEIQILNNNNEEITKQYSINKNNGNIFFKEQTGVDEDLFCSTALVEQGKSKLEKEEQVNLIQKIMNLISTGQENISYKKSIEKLNKKLIEEIGTDRTIGRPINIIKQKIEEENNKKRIIENELEENKIIQKEEINFENKLKEEENKLQIIKQIKNILEKNNIEEEKIKVNDKIIEDYKNQKNNLENKIIEKENKKHSTKNKSQIIIFLLLVFSFTILILNFSKIININNYIYVIYFLIVILSSLLIYNSFKIIKNKKETLRQIEKYKKQKEEINFNINLVENNINRIKKEINEKTKIEYENIKKYFGDKISYYEIQDLLNINSQENIIKNLEEQNSIIEDIKLKINTLKIKEEELKNKELEFNNINNNLKGYYLEKEELENSQESIELAKEGLEKAYNKAKENITPQFKNNLENCINNILGNKYNNIEFNEEKINIELNNGKLISIENLSYGTIHQIYLALRINILNEIINEKIPIILDEPFVYYDEERLENMLKYLQEKYSDRQLIIFSCSKREYDILNKNNIKYNLINL